MRPPSCRMRLMVQYPLGSWRSKITFIQAVAQLKDNLAHHLMHLMRTTFGGARLAAERLERHLCRFAQALAPRTSSGCRSALPQVALLTIQDAGVAADTIPSER